MTRTLADRPPASSSGSVLSVTSGSSAWAVVVGPSVVVGSRVVGPSVVCPVVVGSEVVTGTGPSSSPAMTTTATTIATAAAATMPAIQGQRGRPGGAEPPPPDPGGGPASRERLWRVSAAPPRSPSSSRIVRARRR